MKFRLWLLLSLSAPVALAGTTDLADIPLMSAAGANPVHPNILLMVDDAISMTKHYMPDYVGLPGGDVTSNGTASAAYCQIGRLSSFATGVIDCQATLPPYMSPDFNKQYYSPDIFYQPPIRADGSSYPSMNGGTTANWTSVPTDGFGLFNYDMIGHYATTGKVDLVTPSYGGDTASPPTGFPDQVWCDQDGAAYAHKPARITLPATVAS